MSRLAPGAMCSASRFHTDEPRLALLFSVPSVAEPGFNSTVVPVQIAQHQHEGTAFPVKIESLVTTSRLNNGEITTLVDCGNDLAYSLVVTYFKNAPFGSCGVSGVL